VMMATCCPLSIMSQRVVADVVTRCPMVGQILGRRREVER
jgi:hypothetical protein